MARNSYNAFAGPGRIERDKPIEDVLGVMAKSRPEPINEEKRPAKQTIDLVKVTALSSFFDDLEEQFLRERNRLVPVIAGRQFDSWGEYWRWCLSWLEGDHDAAVRKMGIMRVLTSSGVCPNSSTEEDKERAGRAVLCGVNKIRSAVQLRFARVISMRSRPMFLAETRDRDAEEATKELNRRLDADFDLLRADYIQALAMMNAMIGGSGIVKFAPDYLQHKGLNLELLDPCAVLNPPGTVSVEKSYCLIETSIVRKSWVGSVYGLSDKEAENLQTAQAEDYEHFTIGGNDLYRALSASGEGPQFTKHQEIHYTEGDGTQWLWHRCGRWILYTRKNPFLHRMKPYIRYSNYKGNLGKFLDFGDIHAMAEPQAMEDMAVTNLIHFLSRSMNMPTVVNENMLTENMKEYINLEEIITSGDLLDRVIFARGAPSDVIGYPQPPSVPPAIIYALPFAEQSMQQQGSAYDWQGGRSRSGDSGLKLRTLDVASDRAQEGTLVSCDLAQDKMGRLWASNFFQNGLARALELQEMGINHPAVQILAAHPYLMKPSWIRNARIKIVRRPISESRRQQELAQLGNVISVARGMTAHPSERWMLEALLDILGSPTIMDAYRRSVEAAQAEEDVTSRLMQLVMRLAGDRETGRRLIEDAVKQGTSAAQAVSGGQARQEHGRLGFASLATAGRAEPALNAVPYAGVSAPSSYETGTAKKE